MASRSPAPTPLLLYVAVVSKWHMPESRSGPRASWMRSAPPWARVAFHTPVCPGSGLPPVAGGGGGGGAVDPGLAAFAAEQHEHSDIVVHPLNTSIETVEFSRPGKVRGLACAA